MKQSDTLDMQVRRAKVKVTGFIAVHNVPIAVAEHLRPLFKDIFPDSKIAKNCACGKTKSPCILNRISWTWFAKKDSINNMKNDCYSIGNDERKKTDLKKWIPLLLDFSI